MNVLKAYADAGALSQHGYGPISAPQRATAAAPAQHRKKSGDFLSLSDEAIQFLGQTSGGISVTPQDATYDQHGQITRQLDSLQADLRQLASQFLAQPDGGGMLGHIGAIQSRLSVIRAQV